ncbi:MAG: 2-hydroxyacid dehydrogenase [Betaproteobacteria bacterium]|nr:2-hydroxyacid dehydrogenase [Betaproteobacteria bacterium]
MKPDVLIVAPMYPAAIEALDRAFATHKLWLARERAALIGSVAERVRAIATTAFPEGAVDAALIGALPHLEIIASFGVGVDPIDLEAAKRRNIVVTNTPNVMNDCVADLAIGLIIAAARRLCQGERYVREGKWLTAPLPPAMKVSGKRLGIVGLGRIGRVIAKRAEGFDMRIAYHSRHPVPEVPFPHYGRLTELAAASDFLVVATPGGKDTFHLVDEAVMRALGPQGILVNVARGSVVDERALVQCLQEGALGGAALDVFENEPRVPEALMAMDNVVLEPHVGSGTHETRAAMGQLVVDNLIAHFAGKPPLTPVR